MKCEYKMHKSTTEHSAHFDEMKSCFPKDSGKLTFSDNKHGDSVNYAITYNAIVLNPANACKAGGGWNSSREMNAMEERLCRRSNLVEQLLLASHAVQGPYLDTCKKALTCPTQFMYNDNGVEYTQPHTVTVLSIASPDLKPSGFHRKKYDQDTSASMEKLYYNDMLLYWKLALESTVNASSKNTKPHLVAVPPGDFARTSLRI